MARERFAVYNTAMGETLAIIEMNDNLLRPEAGIVDPTSLTLRPIKSGGVFTLLPVEDHTVDALRKVYAAYRNIKEKPCPLFSTMMGRTDNLLETINLLFGEVEYTVIESAEDMTLLLNPKSKSEHKFKTAKHSILGDMLAKVLDENSPQTTNDK